MMLFYLSLSIFASFLFLRAESIGNEFYGIYQNPCEPNLCADGYTCQADTQGAYCQYIGQSLTSGRTNNVNSNNMFEDPWMLGWILRLIELLATILKTTSGTVDTCDSNPCKFGGKCAADPTTDSVTCECPFPTGGDRCQIELGGCKNCARKGKLFLVPLNDKEINFDDAVAACHKKGLQMFQPETKDVNQFAVDFLVDQRDKNLGPKTENYFYGYWIGLRRENKNDTFKWLEDDKGLDAFKYWGPGNPEKKEQNCVIIPSLTEYNFTWVNMECDKIFHQLCYGFFPDTDK